MTVRTPLFRVSYPNVFTPTKYDKNDSDDKLQYSCALVFDKKAQKSKAYKELVQAAKDALKEKFGDKAGQVWKKMKTPLFRPYEDLSEAAQKDFDEDVIWCRAKSKRKPEIIDCNGGAQIFKESDFYAGCYAIASLNPYAYDYSGNRGVGLGLQALIKMEDGDRLGNVVDAKSEFEDLMKEADPVDDDDSDDNDPDGW